MTLADGPAGVRGILWDERDPSACLPCPTAMGATWDEEFVEILATFLAKEAKRKGVDAVLGPTLNLHRSPLSGRHFECFSEDPLLTGRLGASFVRGLQRCGIAACPKHYVANESETNRFTIDVHVDERTLREVYLWPFEQAVAAGAWLIMSAYNSVNGRTMTENQLLQEPLKTDWGFDGVVVSDWGAIRSTSASANSANDLAMPGPCDYWGPALAEAIDSGEVLLETIDEKVRRILLLAMRVCALSASHENTTQETFELDGRSLLREASARSMVLLRNEGKLLPLKYGSIRKVAVIGHNALDTQHQGGGAAQVVPTRTISALDGLQKAFSGIAEVVYCPGRRDSTDDSLRPIPLEQLRNPVTAEPGSSVEFFDRVGRLLSSESRATSQFVWFGPPLPHVGRIVINTEFTARSSGSHRLAITGLGSNRSAGSYRILVDELVVREDVVQTANDGSPSALASPTWVDVNVQVGESVRLSVTYEPNAACRSVAITLCVQEPTTTDETTKAVAAAQEADLAIVVVGSKAFAEGEGYDRKNLALPDGQDQLVSAVAAANPATVVVVNSGSPVVMPWSEQVPAIIVAWFPGQEFGDALGDVLLGRHEPAGRLPTTWPAAEGDVPVLETAPSSGKLVYSEGVHIGYRAWVRAQRKPAYPFGYGMGFTAWKYHSLKLPDSIHAGENMIVNVLVENIGDRSGSEVVQIYLKRLRSAIDRPSLWLAGFTRLIADPGQQHWVNIDIDARAFQHWDTQQRQWANERGAFTLLAGGCSEILPLQAEVVVE
ncbi:glycoside hydrolase family 3 C-terminal domain-containing protein [Haloechinothrix salitolerans]|uniref:Glycoside hydrolase family 3 C-terminal domain-containing protein n=2 Tax=Haloechinothrix salitolerans TaxID=926830 RepID=A0ABW2BY23_9PSEU